jgi:hypothetical protein
MSDKPSKHSQLYNADDLSSSDDEEDTNQLLDSQRPGNLHSKGLKLLGSATLSAVIIYGVQ